MEHYLYCFCSSRICPKKNFKYKPFYMYDIKRSHPKNLKILFFQNSICIKQIFLKSYTKNELFVKSELERVLPFRVAGRMQWPLLMAFTSPPPLFSSGVFTFLPIRLFLGSYILLGLLCLISMGVKATMSSLHGHGEQRLPSP